MALANSLAFLLYLCCSVVLIRDFVQRDQQRSILFPVSILTIVALVAHGADIFFTMKSAGGWDLRLFATLEVATWLMALIAFILGSKLPKAHPGMIIYPVVALSLILKTSLPSEQGSTLANPALEWHILLSLAAYSL
ncbi:MAG: phosphohydrolase, partial [Methylophaga sp.]|nr:phosphohydrolase [Methylophaga sp.]